MALFHENNIGQENDSDIFLSEKLFFSKFCNKSPQQF